MTAFVARLGRLQQALPQGRTLPEEDWLRRHRALVVLLWLHAVGLPLFGVLRGYGALHSLEEGLVLAALAGLAMVAGRRKRVASALVSLGLISSSAILVHLWGGVIEAHFHFFVMIVLLSLYEDWVPFLLAAAYVVIHHGLTGALDPASVYNHSDAVAHPWRWAAIHGFFVTSAGIGAVVAWRLNENLRAETHEAHRQARESEERFRSAFESAPIGMALASIEPADAGRFLQVNHAMTEITGRSKEELVGKSFRDITHPEDLEASAVPLARLASGELSEYRVQKRYVRADGRVLWGLLSVSLVRDGSGDPVYAIGQVQDITERVRAEEQLAYQAHHDPLTGLANRRKLLGDLERRLAAARREQLLLLLFDLDGFKAYNDSFGHPAGDSLLTRLGHNLVAAVEGRGVAYRMGGDEFCVLGELEADGSESLAAAAGAALRERGEGFTITASYGSVVLPLEASDAAEALRIADQRMYARKGRGRTSAAKQATDALVRALAERSADLGTHLSDVTERCAATAERLGLPDEQMTPLLQAATLHDVGKIAIPDAVLDKPGPLDEAEWEFMRTHTLIGERILAEAPALSEAARIVRCSHERFDGRGYPDGLKGDEIPLPARIIAVCDAYDAMITDRPYRPAMSQKAAIAELRRASGWQFDPDVVEAFLAGALEPRGVVVSTGGGQAPGRTA